MIGIQRLTMIFLLTIPIVAGISTLELPTSSGFTFTGLVWVAQLVVGMLLLGLGCMQPTYRGGARAWWPWSALCFWIWLSILWCHDFSRRNVQEALQLSMPLLIGVLAASIIRTREDLKWLLRMFAVTFVLVAIYAAVYVGGVLDEEWVQVRARPAALTTALVGCVFLAGLSQHRWRSLSVWGICVALTTLTESRMATLALLGALVLYPARRSKLWNVVNLVAIAILGSFLFNTEIFQQRFFEGGSGSLSDVAEGDFSTAGRFDAWPYIWDEAWQHPILGAGVGSAFDFVPTVWTEVNYVHNDYLRFFFELGLVGLALFIIAAIWQLALLYERISSADGVLRTAFIACWLGFCVLLISCATDNTILYNIYFTNPLFAVLGGAYGLAWAESQAKDLVDRADVKNVPIVRIRSTRAVYGHHGMSSSS